MPRKTRILHDEDEYLFVETPGDAEGPALLIFAHPENPRAVSPGRLATHTTEHGTWCAIARFDGETLFLAPEPPEGLHDRLKAMLPRYVAVQRDRATGAKNTCFFVMSGGTALHALHPAQPAGLLLKLWRNPEDAKRANALLPEPGSVQPTGDLREFLALRAEEGFAGGLLDEQEVIYFCIDGENQMQYVKVKASAGASEVESQLLDARGRWQDYEGDEVLDAYFDPESWDRLMVRVFGVTPFVGFHAGAALFTLQRDGACAVLRDVDVGQGAPMIALFHSGALAESYRVAHRLGKLELDRVEDLKLVLRSAAEQGGCVRLAPGEHRARAATLWLDGEAVVLDSFSGLWRSGDGQTFTRID